jgi:hypothetical protein
MPKHQAHRSFPKTRVTELPARARWAPSGSCRNSETGREARQRSQDRAGPSSGQTAGSRRGAPPGRIQQAQRAAHLH